MPSSQRLSKFSFHFRSPFTSPNANAGAFEAHNTSSLSSTSSSPEKTKAFGVVSIDNPDSASQHNIAPSPLTPWHDAFRRDAAANQLETQYSRRSLVFSYTRIFLSVVSIAVLASIIGLAAHQLNFYNTTSRTSGTLQLQFWPSNLSTHSILPCVILLPIAALVFLIYLLGHLLSICIPGAHGIYLNALFLLAATISLILSLTALIIDVVLSPQGIFSSFVSETVSKYQTTSGPQSTVGLESLFGSGGRETIQSFTCAVMNTARTFSKEAGTLKLQNTSTGGTGMAVPGGFRTVCTESYATGGLLIGIVVLSVIAVTVGALAMVSEIRIRRHRAERGFKEALPESMVSEHA